MDYTITYVCTNCGRESTVSYPKGTKASQTVNCKHCGCYGTAVKTWPIRPLRGHKSTGGRWDGGLAAGESRSQRWQ